MGQEPVDHRSSRASRCARRDGEDNPDGGNSGGYGFNDYRGLFTFREPRAFGTTGDAQFTAFVEQGLRSSFDFNRKGVTADYAKRFTGFTVTGRYTFDYTKLFNEQIAPEDQLLIDRLFPQVRLSKVFGSVLRDSRDDVLDPQTGAVLGVDGSVAAKVLGSEVGFVKTFAQALHLPPPAGPRLRAGGRRAAWRRGRLRAGGADRRRDRRAGPAAGTAHGESRASPTSRP